MTDRRRIAWPGGALLFFLLVAMAWPVGDAETVAALDVPTTTAARSSPTPTGTPSGTAPAGRRAVSRSGGGAHEVLPIVRRDATSTPAPLLPRTNMAVGAGVIDDNFEMVRDMGFPWLKLNVDWANSPDPTGLVDAALQRYPGVRILLRIDNSPGYVRTGNDDDPLSANEAQAYLQNLAARLRGKVQAYELFNEPNLKLEWNSHIAGGTGFPSIRGYVRILQIAYPAIKAGDPGAIVISGGLSSAGSGGPDAVGDLDFINQLYQLGGQNSLDALGSHPYGGACVYDAGTCLEGIYFRRAETQHAVMTGHGDNRPIWATELGWLVDPRVYGHGECMAGLGGRADWVRAPNDVADQLSRAYRYAADNWPWLGGMFFFNFDYSAAGWVQGYDRVCDAPTWYSIVSKGNMPPRPYTEPAFGALLQFARDYRLTTR